MEYPKDRNVHRPAHIFLPGAFYFVSARTYFALPYFREKEAKQILLETIKKAARKFSVTLFGWVILDNHYHLLLKVPDENNKLKIVSPKLINTVRKKSDSFQSVIGSNKLKLVTASRRQMVKLTTLSSRQTSETRSITLGKVIGFIHGRSSRLLRKHEAQKGQAVVYDFTPHEFAILKHKFLKHLDGKSFLIERRRTKRFKRLIDTGDIKGLEKFMKNAPKIWYQYLDHIITNEGDFYRHLNYIHQNPVKHGVCQNLLDYNFSSIHKYIENFGKEWITDCFRKYPIIDFCPTFEDW